MATLVLACRRLHAPASPIHTLHLYRALRCFAGPALAFRLTFARRAGA
ncbi:hypothetical protein [Zoogloea sp.]